MQQNTRARAEKSISQGNDPTPFLAHPNYHVRLKAQHRLSRDRFNEHRLRNLMYAQVSAIG